MDNMDIIDRLCTLHAGTDREAAIHHAAMNEIDRLRLIEAAAKNLVAQKGRHNTEIAYKRLAEVLA